MLAASYHRSERLNCDPVSDGLWAVSIEIGGTSYPAAFFATLDEAKYHCSDINGGKYGIFFHKNRQGDWVVNLIGM